MAHESHTKNRDPPPRVCAPKLTGVNTGRRQGASWVTQVGDEPHWPAGGFLLAVCVAEVTGAASVLSMPHCPKTCLRLIAEVPRMDSTDL